MQPNPKTVEVVATNQEDQDWLGTDLSHLSEYESYDWGKTLSQMLNAFDLIGKLFCKETDYTAFTGFNIDANRHPGLQL
jgi:hypothetical protein